MLHGEEQKLSLLSPMIGAVRLVLQRREMGIEGKKETQYDRHV